MAHHDRRLGICAGRHYGARRRDQRAIDEIPTVIRLMKLEARDAARVRCRIALAVAVLLDVTNRVFHDFETLA